MTARSERRDREMAVIDAAVAWVAAHSWYSGQGAHPTALKLRQVVAEYSKHELAEPSKTYTNIHSPETAHEAGEWAKKFALTDAGEVFRRIYYAWRRWSRHPIESVDNEGLTSDEVEADLNRTHQSISARVNELKNSGWLVDSGQRRKTRSGGNAIVWTPSAAAIQWVNEHGMPIPVSSRG